MTRPSISNVLMQSAQLWSRRSTCSRLQVGAVAALGGRVVVSGYNGAVSGAEHCKHECDCRTSTSLHASGCATKQQCTESVHAEANLVAFAAREGIALYGTAVYTTHAPCVGCARLLVNAGVFYVVFQEHYRDEAGLNLLRDNGVYVYFEPEEFDK